jgi:hypothetical protein
MKINYFFVIIICFSQMLMSQTLKIYKNDKTTLDFTLADIDSISFSTSPGGKLVTSSNWICFTSSPIKSIIEPSQGIYEQAEDGLKIYGATNNFNCSVQLMPVSQNSIMSKSIYLKWKANGNGHLVNIGLELYLQSDNMISAGRVLNFSTNQQTSGSVLIFDDIWYYTRISVVPGKVTSVTSTGNYDNIGGEVVSNTSLNINNDIGTFSFQTFTDNTSYAILAESWIE